MRPFDMRPDPTPSEPAHQTPDSVGLIFSVFFLSGMAGLVYQVAWSRLLTLLVGVSIFAITAVICTFMIGLALGSYLIGRWGDGWRDPLLAYGMIEGAIGLYALFTPWIFAAIQPAYVWGFESLGRFGLNTLRVLLSAGVLLVPTVLMGGTLPLLSRAVSSRNDRTVSGSGLLYAVNTFRRNDRVCGCRILFTARSRRPRLAVHRRRD
jgi:spermidine synthase